MTVKEILPHIVFLEYLGIVCITESDMGCAFLYKIGNYITKNNDSIGGYFGGFHIIYDTASGSAHNV